MNYLIGFLAIVGAVTLVVLSFAFISWLYDLGSAIIKLAKEKKNGDL